MNHSATTANRTPGRSALVSSLLAALCSTTRLALLLVVVVGVAAAGAQERPDRYERRSSEMALPDPVLDPFAEQPLPPLPGLLEPRVPDNVDHVPLDEEQQLDAAEREEYERYMIERGLMRDPHDDLGQDRWDGGAATPEQAGPDPGADPVEW